MSKSNCNSNEHKAAKPMVWFKDRSGNTYICPKYDMKDPRNISEEELSLCLDESQNPQNN